MEWIYATLVLVALVYAAAMTMEYMNHSTRVTPKIRSLEEGVVDLNLEANAEAELLDEVHVRIEDTRQVVTDLRRQTSEMRDRLRAEQERKRRLEIAVFRKRLRSRERLAA